MASGTSRDWEKEATEGSIKSSNDEKDEEYDKILETMSKMNLNEPGDKEKYRIAQKELMMKSSEKLSENVLVTGDLEVRATKEGKVKDANFMDLMNDPVKRSEIENRCKTILNNDPYNTKSAIENVLATSDYRAIAEKIRNVKDPKNVVEVAFELSSQLLSLVEDQEKKQTKEEAKAKSDSIIRQAYMDKMRGVVKIRTDDGDQTPMSGQEGLILDILMGGGLDWQPTTCFSSTWMDVLAFGDFEGMLNYIKNKTSEEIRQLLELRETSLNYSALHHVIRGLLIVSNQEKSDHIESKSKHMECFCKLIDLGANIHARDMIGFTPLMLCCCFTNSHQEINQKLSKMSKILLKHGADPNAKDRRGNTALRGPAMKLNFEFVQLLLEAGADPTIPNNDGDILECSLGVQHSTLNRLFAAARKMRTKQVREKAKEEAGGVLKKCDVCGDSSEKSRCTGCYMARYCGKECQNLDWKKHRKLCRQIREQYVSVNLTVKDDLIIRKRSTGQVKLVHKLQKPDKEHFVVKVQIPIDHRSRDLKIEKNGLMLNDKMMSVVGEIKDDEPVYTALLGKIQADGVFGQKGFFYAILDEEKNMKVNATKILPPELW